MQARSLIILCLIVTTLALAGANPRRGNRRGDRGEGRGEGRGGGRGGRKGRFPFGKISSAFDDSCKATCDEGKFSIPVLVKTSDECPDLASATTWKEFKSEWRKVAVKRKFCDESVSIHYSYRNVSRIS